LVLMSVERLYVPVGFDDNDEIQVVVEGKFPDTCYRVAFNEVDVDAATNVVRVRQWARKFPGICLPVILPFTAEARVGQLPRGEYSVQANGVDAEQLAVSFGVRPGPDEFLYAPIERARVEAKADGTLRGIIEGRFTNTCMKLDETRVIDSGKTIEILPIIEMVDRDDCTAAEVPFSWTFDLPGSAGEARRLMHVRSLNGKAVNVVF
jgi:hypothetical protein